MPKFLDTTEQDGRYGKRVLTVTTRRHATSGEVGREMDAPTGDNGEISDSAALAIASWYASPGHADDSGRVMTQLATTGTVTSGELLDAIYTERQTTAKGDAYQERALDLLATWALHHYSLED